MTELKVTGADDLESLAKRLKAVGSNDLRKELLRGMREQGKPVIKDVRESARANLPKRGGLAALVAGSKFATRTKLSGKSVGVRLIGTNAHNVEAIDKGILRHPVFGKKGWTTQSVRPGWFSGPVEHDANRLRTGMQQVMADIAHKIERSL